MSETIAAQVRKNVAAPIRVDAQNALSAIQRTMASLVASLPHTIRRPTDLQHALGLDYKLCWQIYSIATSKDALLMVQNVPSPAAVKKLVGAVANAGVGQDVQRNLMTATEEFENIVTRHAGDRAQFNSMIATMAGSETAETIDLQNRRTAFRSESQLWGAQVACYLHQSFFRLSDDGNSTEQAFINAKHGFQHLRTNAMAIIQGTRANPEKDRTHAVIDPLDAPAARLYGAPVLPEFCSQPLPEFHTYEHTDNWTYTVLKSPPVGRTGSVNLTFGGHIRHVPFRYDQENKRRIYCGMRLVNPTEIGVQEIIIHRAMVREIEPLIRTYAAVSGTTSPVDVAQTQQFPIFEQLIKVGTASSLVPLHAIEGYTAMLGKVFELLKWNPDEFDVYRLQWQYPVLNSILEISFPAP